MDKGRKYILFTPSGCLSDEGLSLFTRGMLVDSEIETVKNHLQSCELCALAFEGYLSADPDEFSEDIKFLNLSIDKIVSTSEETIPKPAFTNITVVSNFSESEKKDNNLVPANGSTNTDKPDVTFHNKTDKSKPGRKHNVFISRYRNELIAAVLLLFIGFGSRFVYLQLKNTGESQIADMPELSVESVYPFDKVKPDSENRVLISPGGTTSKEPVKEIAQVTIIENDLEEVAMVENKIPVQSGDSIDEKKKEVIVEDDLFPVTVTESEESITSGIVINNEVVSSPEVVAYGSSLKTARKSVELKDNEIAEREIFAIVEESPHYPGGDLLRLKFLQENVHYPQAAREALIQGVVYLTFVVEKDGSITDVHVLRGIGGGCDEEAIRVIKQMPKWIPGKQRGNPVRVQFNLQINFKLAG